MTKHCDTCRFRVSQSSSAPVPSCLVLERELLGRTDERTVSLTPPLQPPPDFGCIYHEEFPSHCRNCAHWGATHTQGFVETMHICEVGTVFGQKTLITDDGWWCDQWGEKHG